MAGGGWRPTRSQSGQHLGQHLAALAKRGAQRVLLAHQRGKAPFGAVAGGLQLLHLLAGIDQRLVEGGAVLVEGVDFLGELRPPLDGKRDVAGDRIELGLAGVALAGGAAVGRRLRRGEPGGKHGGEQGRGKAQSHLSAGVSCLAGALPQARGNA